jgi:hypothetical protein
MTDFLLMVGGALFAMFVSGIVNYRKSVWVGLTDEDIEGMGLSNYIKVVRETEDKLKEKNT